LRKSRCKPYCICRIAQIKHYGSQRTNRSYAPTKADANEECIYCGYAVVFSEVSIQDDACIHLKTLNVVSTVENQSLFDNVYTPDEPISMDDVLL